MADAIRPTKSVESYREPLTAHAAARPGAAAGADAAGSKADAAHDTPLHDAGPATVVDVQDLGEGRSVMTLSDGRCVHQAANGTLREDEPDGSMRLSLPNGMLIERDADGKTVGYDPASGRTLDVSTEQHAENGQLYFGFEDPAGNRWTATSETLRFEITNAAGTVHEKVCSTGTIQIASTTVLRDESGVFRQESATITVRPDGEVIGQGVREGTVGVTRDTITFHQSTGTRVESDLPYPLPTVAPAKAPVAAPAPSPSTLVQTEPEAPVESGAPPADVPGAPAFPGQPASPVAIPPNAYGPAAAGFGLPCAPGTGMPMPSVPGMPCGMPAGYPPGMPLPAPVMGMPQPLYPYGQGAPWQMPPFSLPANGPVGLPSDPYATVPTAAGAIRGAQPDGSSFISLPNGVVVAQGPDGQFTAHDARANGPLPVVAQDVVTPNGGPEKQIVFRDAVGNEYLMYSKSLDFAVTSADGRLRQIVMPQGNMLVMAEVPTTDPQGQPTTQQVMVELLPDGRANTFGAPNVFLGLDALTVGTPAGPAQMALPYPVPAFQGLLATVQGVAQYPTAVSGTMYTPSTQPMPPAMPMPPAPPTQGAPMPPAPPAPATAPASPTAAGAPTAEIEAQIKAGVAQLVGPSGDPKVGQELEALYLKAVTGQATEADVARLQSLEQTALAANPALQAQLQAQAEAAQASAGAATSTPAAPEAPSPAAAEPAAQPAPAQAEAAPPSVAAELPVLDEQQTASVKQAIEQMQAAGADEATLAELQPLLMRIVVQKAAPEEMQRADALIQAVLAKQAPAPAPVDPRDQPAPYGIPHIADANELWAAANGRPEFAYASNTPVAYQEWATQVAQASAQARAAQEASAASPAPAAPEASQPRDGVASPSSYSAAPTVSFVPPTPPMGGAVGAPSVGGTAGPGQPLQATPASGVHGPHKPGVWNRMKSFFTGNPAGAPRHSNWNPYAGMSGYPCQMYGASPYAPYRAMQTMLTAQMLTTTLSTMMFMPSMYYWNPIGFMGGFGTFPGVLW